MKSTNKVNNKSLFQRNRCPLFKAFKTLARVGTIDWEPRKKGKEKHQRKEKKKEE